MVPASPERGSSPNPLFSGAPTLFSPFYNQIQCFQSHSTVSRVVSTIGQIFGTTGYWNWRSLMVTLVWWCTEIDNEIICCKSWRIKLEPKKTRTVRVNFHCWPIVGINTIYLFATPNKPHRTTSQNGRNTTVRLPPPWRILAITWPKIMLRKNWSNQNERQDHAPDMDERRGVAQRFDRSRVSLLDMSCFFLITSSSTWVLMMIW